MRLEGASIVVGRDREYVIVLAEQHGRIVD
jgi:hypothetical protein